MGHAIGELFDILTKILPSHRGPFHLHEPVLGKEDEDAVLACIREGYVSSVGSRVKLFEEKLSEVVNAKHVVCVSSGTVALYLLLYSLGIGPGQEVICPALTFVGTANAIFHTGATPHFVESDEKTLAIDAEALRKHLTKITQRKEGKLINKSTQKEISAILVVHVFGHSAQLAALQKVADEFGLALLEDAAESMGTTYKNRAVGAYGLAGITSFNGNKIITTGGGGAVFTNDAQLAQRIKHLSSTAKKGHPFEFIHDEIGFNFRMPNLNAALGLSQLSRLEYFLAKKRQLAEVYQQAFKDAEHWEFVQEPLDSKSNRWLNAVKLKKPCKKTIEHALVKLGEHKIHCRPVWRPLHLLPMYQNNPRSNLAVTEKLYKQLINLPSGSQIIGDTND